MSGQGRFSIWRPALACWVGSRGSGVELDKLGSRLQGQVKVAEMSQMSRSGCIREPCACYEVTSTESAVGAGLHSSSLDPVVVPLLELPVFAILGLGRLGMTTERWQVAVRSAQEMKYDSAGSRSIFLFVEDRYAAPRVDIMCLVPGNIGQ